MKLSPPTERPDRATRRPGPMVPLIGSGDPPEPPGAGFQPPDSSMPRPSPAKVRGFIALCAVCALVSVGYVARAVGQDRAAGSAAGATEVPLTEVKAIEGPRLMFHSTAAGERRGHLALTALDDVQGPRALTDFDCARLDYRSDIGLCLTPATNLLAPANALVFDAAYEVLYKLRVAGLPSRVRVSPDGRWGASTSFVQGHSYADETFSTETLLFDLHQGEVIENLESFDVYRDGERFRDIDFNFWGVTFADDNNTFYATLGTGDHRYLVEGDIAERRMTVLRDGVECPSLSPDNTRIAFKQRVDSAPGTVSWNLAVLDLESMEETAVAETRNVDDQAAWLDDDTLLYGLRPNPASTNADTWAVPADGTGQPTVFLPQAWSTVVAG